MQALQQHGGHGRNNHLQFLGRLHGNYAGGAGKETPFQQVEGGILKCSLRLDSLSPFESHPSTKVVCKETFQRRQHATSPFLRV